MNYVDGGYVIDDLKELARAADGERVSIQWVPDGRQKNALTQRVLKSIANYKAHFPRLVQDSGAELSAVQEFRTDIYLKPSKQIAVEAYLKDDRGREYVTPVYF